MSKNASCLVPLCIGILSSPLPFANGENVAVIDTDEPWPVTEGQGWCQFLSDHGHSCTLFPKEGPTSSLNPFDVVVDLSHHWADPAGTLADFMRTGKTVITKGLAPQTLGITSNSTVRAWVGADATYNGQMDVVTVTHDPILGDIPPGTLIAGCGAGICIGLLQNTAHPMAKVLARFTDPYAGAGILRNIWGGGVSVYLTQYIAPGKDSVENRIILNSIQAHQLTVPTLGQWGALILALSLVAGGVIVVHRRRT
jgi:hypothetical protein